MEKINITYTLITGASGGIGYEFARVFAKENHNLLTTWSMSGSIN